MPPRYAFWTILIDKKPTAFRARDKEELLPTFAQLRRTNSDVVIKWFARGQLWDTPEQAQWAGKHLPGAQEKRPREWRPGGEHKDPRARFDKRKDGHRAAGVGSTPERHGAKPWGPPREKRKGEHQAPRARFDNRTDGRQPAGVGRTPERHGAKPWGAKPRASSPEPLRGAKAPSNRAGGGAPARVREGGTPRPPKNFQHRDPPARFDKRTQPAGRPPFEGGQRGPKGQPPWRDKKHGSGRSFEAKKPERPGFKKLRPRPDRSVDVPPGRREEEPPKRRDEAPEAPPPPEQIVTRPEPPERG